MASELLKSQMVFVFFLYGLAFFAMGLAVTLESRRSSDLALARYLPWLGAFGLLQATVAWMDMTLAMPGDSPAPPVFAPLHRLQPLNCLACHQRPGSAAVDLALDASAAWDGLRLLLLVAAGLCLVQFGAGLLFAGRTRHRWLVWTPWGLAVLWLVGLVVARSLSAEGNWVWLTAGGILARYALHLPGSFLAGVALLRQRGALADLGRLHLGRDGAGAAALLLLYAVVSGLVVPPAPFFPASLLNYATFYAATGVPVQVVRAAAAMGIAWFVVRTLRLFETEYQMRLHRAIQERFEAQERARHQLEEWNRDLEAKVAQCTAEVEQRNQQLAIVQERERLAREMHDSLGQSIGYLNLRLLGLRSAVAAGDKERSLAELEALESGLGEAGWEMREALQDLRAKAPPEGGLISALNDLLVRFGERTGIAAGLLRDNGVALRISAEAELQVLRIVQEALTNVRKHAQAHRVWVRAVADGATVTLVVEDDGCGFRPSGVADQGERRFGLQTMRERAEAIGGSLRVDSEPAAGTRVILRLPLAAGGGG